VDGKNLKTITLQLPAYIDSGAQIHLLNMGEPGRDGGSPGHLYLRVSVNEHPVFKRLGRDILIDLPVSVDYARRGGQLCIPDIVPGKSFLVNLPAGLKAV